MLTQLHIENVAVIERADIDFEPGFNVLTGETGAGKSMVIDSILAILGERTYRDIIRTGEKKATVSAVFQCPPEAAAAIAEFVDDPTELLVERQIHADGRNICKINGKASSLPVLRAVGTRLLSVHGQHDGQRLLSEEYHLEYLDGFAGSLKLLGEYAAEYEKWQRLRKELSDLDMDEREKNRLKEILKYQIDDIDAASLRPGEDEEIEQRRSLLRNSQKISDAIGGALWALDGDQDSDGAVSLIGRAASSMERVGDLTPELEELLGRLTELRYAAEDVYERINDLGGSLRFSPEELEELENRRETINRLKKKYGGTVEAVLEFRDKCAEELDNIVFSAERAEKLEKEVGIQYDILAAKGKELTALRSESALRLGEAVKEQLESMDMKGVRLIAEISPSPEPLTNGFDSVRFLLSANVGEEPRPLARIASGGELSRIMLALQNVLTENDIVSTLIFDEVDAGISGRAAHAVGEKLSSLAKKKQVICVTHLPRIAGFGNTHFLIKKGARDGRTYTSVTKLEREQRVREIARMTGGREITEAALQSAREMIAD